MNTRKMTKTMRCWAILLMMVMTVSVAHAIPAKQGVTRKITLADGTKLTARLVGDEHGHFWLGENGNAYLKDVATGYYMLKDRDALNEKSRTRRASSNMRRAARLAPQKAKGVGEVNNFTGKKKGIIILVAYADVPFEEKHTNSFFNRMVNERNYSEGPCKGSMTDYFIDQSEGQFELDFDIAGPYTLSRNRSYYGANDGEGNDNHPGLMVADACKMANADVNFADYDWDGDGVVDQVYVLYAGEGEADGGPDETVWPHEFSLSSASYSGDGPGALTLDGVKVDTYACGQELNAGSGLIAGIGVMCHEFSHCLGYPDFYDTDYSGGQGMGSWDLMDQGSYNGDSYQPSGYTSWERWAAGWKEPIELTADTQVTGMKSLTEGGKAYIIYNDNNKDEYFLLENRQFVSWDESLPGRGLLIVHVDYKASTWASNKPNDNPDHQRMTWIPADNVYNYFMYQGTKYYSFDGMRTDTYPYGSNDAFSKMTSPAAEFYNNTSNGTKFMDFAVKKITQNRDRTISFTFKAETVANPVISPSYGTFTEAQYVTITCASEGATIYYTIDGSTPNTNSLVYTEPFLVETNTTIKAIAVKDDDVSAVVTASLKFRSGSSEDVKTFKLVKKVDDVASGLRYIIACPSKKAAAGAINKTFLSKVDVEVNDDVVTINDDVMVFTLNGNGSFFSLRNNEGQYLYSSTTKTVGFGDEEVMWEMKYNVQGVVLTCDEGVVLYNSSSPRFTTYDTGTSRTMLYCYLYAEYDDPDGISEVKATSGKSSGEIYTISGVRMTNQHLPKGIYIINGKKVVIR